MPPKTLKQALTNMLENLSANNLRQFRHAILNREEEPRVRTNALEGKDYLDIADVLVSTFTEEGVIQVALETLEKIGCNEERKSLAKETMTSDFRYGDIMEVKPSGASAQTAQQDMLKYTAKETLTSDSRYGDIMEVKPSGASAQTAQQDMLKYTGVRASYAMAETDLQEMKKYKTIIKNVACEKEVDAALIAAIISRSCRAGKALKEGKGRYDEKCFGLMQIHEVHEPKGSWNSEEHLGQATDILIYCIIRIKNAFPDWTKEEQLKGGIAAYSAGDGNIKSFEAVDARTPCGDYSNDVVARAQWYKIHGGF